MKEDYYTMLYIKYLDSRLPTFEEQLFYAFKSDDLI